VPKEARTAQLDQELKPAYAANPLAIFAATGLRGSVYISRALDNRVTDLSRFVAAVFADSSYWIALLNPRDDLHTIAEQLSKQYQETLTSEMVLTEFANYFSGGGANIRGAAVSFIQDLRKNAALPDY